MLPFSVSTALRLSTSLAALLLLQACVENSPMIPQHRTAYFKQQAWEDGCASAIGAPALGRSSYAGNSLLAVAWDQGNDACARGTAGPAPAAATSQAAPAAGSPGETTSDLPTSGTVIQ